MYWLVITVMLFALHAVPLQAAPKPECTLFFESDCLALELQDLASLLGKPLAVELELTAAALALELQLPRQYQYRVWPYHFRTELKQPIESLFINSVLLPIWRQAQTLSKQVPQTTHVKLDFHQCMANLKPAPEPPLKLVDLALCSSPHFNITLDSILQNKLTLTLDPNEKLDLLRALYQGQIDQGQLETTPATEAQIILNAATQSKAVQIDQQIQIIHILLSYGFIEPGLQKINQFTTHVDFIVAALNRLQSYKNLAQFIEYARGFRPITSDDAKSALYLLQAPLHVTFLEGLQTENQLQQLSLHRLTVQAFFTSLLNASPSHDLVLGYHAQQWLKKWRELVQVISNSNDRNLALDLFTEGLKMLHLHARISSYSQHHKLILQNRL